VLVGVELISPHLELGQRLGEPDDAGHDPPALEAGAGAGQPSTLVRIWLS